MIILSDKEKQIKRLDICMSCDQLKLLPLLRIMQCKACGCPVKTKISLNIATCPKGKW